MLWTFSQSPLRAMRSVKSAAAIFLAAALAAVPTPSEAQGGDSAFDAAAAAGFPALAAPGMAVAVVKGDRILWAKGYGMADLQAGRPVTTATAFTLGSGTKMVTATALMQLHERNMFALDDDVNGYLPFSVRNPSFPDVPITFRMLLSHGSSIGDNWAAFPLVFDGTPVPPLGEALRAYFDQSSPSFDPKSNFLPWAPGTRWSYSNVGFSLLGYLVERIAGTPYEVYCQDHVLRPLGISAGFFLRDFAPGGVPLAVPHGRHGRNGPVFPYGLYEGWVVPAGFMKADVMSYARFLLLHMNRGKLPNEPLILHPETVAMMHAPAYADVQGYWVETGESFYGMGFVTGGAWGANMVGHEGAWLGVYSYAFYNTTTDIGVVILTNGDTFYMKEFWVPVDALVASLMSIASTYD